MKKKNKKYVNIIAILDRSGSMSSIIDDAIGGFNTFLENQKSIKGLANMSIMLFDTQFDIITDKLKIQDVLPFTKKPYVPRGGTSLYDAIGKTIDGEIENLSTLPKKERPEKTLCVILTDGEENSSREYHKEKINKMINDMRENFNWEFLFLAANQDACLTAEGLGISKGNSLDFSATADGVQVAYTSMSNATTMYRTKSSKSYDNLFEDSKK